jgi:hypothetical protein
MDIIVTLHCLNLALDHTRENIMLSKSLVLLKFHNVLAFIPTEGRLLIKLIPQVLTCSQNSNGSQKFWNKEWDEKELNQVHKFKPPCILLMNSHLILSLKPIYSTPFPLITFIYVVGFIWSFLEKLGPTKILNDDDPFFLVKRLVVFFHGCCTLSHKRISRLFNR